MHNPDGTLRGRETTVFTMPGELRVIHTADVDFRFSTGEFANTLALAAIKDVLVLCPRLLATFWLSS